MPWVAARTLLNVKPPLLSWKAPTPTAIIGSRRPSVTYTPNGTIPATRRSQRRASFAGDAGRAAGPDPRTPGPARDPGALLSPGGTTPPGGQTKYGGKRQ